MTMYIASDENYCFPLDVVKADVDRFFNLVPWLREDHKNEVDCALCCGNVLIVSCKLSLHIY